MRRTALILLGIASIAWATGSSAFAQSGARGAVSAGYSAPADVLDSIPQGLRLVSDEEEKVLPSEGIDRETYPTEEGEMSYGSETLFEDESPCCDGSGCSECGDFHPVTQWLLNSVITGWIDQGYTWNPDNPTNQFNTPTTFNDRANEYQLNQGYLSLAREVDRCGTTWDLGGRVDFLWGSDYFFTTSTGLETRQDGTQRWNSNSGPRGIGAPLHGISMPQLYAEVFLPIWQGFSVKMGHFYSDFGVESVMSPQNFFYSHSYAFQYAEPKTYTGLMTTFQASRGLAFRAGFHRGWDAWQGTNNQLQFAGGVDFTSLDDRWNFALNITHGHEDPAGALARTGVSTVLNYQITPCAKYAFQYTYGTEEGIGPNGTDAQWYGINQYFTYTLSPQTEMGMRVEWFRDVDNARVLGISDGSATGEDYTAVTLGLNWRPRNNFMVRPEVRWDWSDVQPPLGSTGMFNTFTEKNQFLAAVDVIWRF